MHGIAALCGAQYGPSACNITPRSCVYCGYYGHTRQHCPKRKRDEERTLDKAIAENKRQCADIDHERERLKQSRAAGPTQAQIFDQLGQPYITDSYVGPILATEEGEGDGMWRIEGGRIVPSSQTSS